MAVIHSSDAYEHRSAGHPSRVFFLEYHFSTTRTTQFPIPRKKLSVSHPRIPPPIARVIPSIWRAVMNHTASQREAAFTRKKATIHAKSLIGRERMWRTGTMI